MPSDERLVEEHDRERDGEERRHPHGRRGPRRPCIADREREEDLGDARRENAGECERPDGGTFQSPTIAADDERDAVRRDDGQQTPRRAGRRRGRAPGGAPRSCRRRAPQSRARGRPRPSGRPASRAVDAACRPPPARRAGSRSSITAQPAQPSQPRLLREEQHAEERGEGRLEREDERGPAAVVRDCTQVATR